MKTVSDIPVAWVEYLAEVQKTFPNAVIAGGCLRDWMLGKLDVIKDIDVFLPGSSDAEVYGYVNGAGTIIRNRTKNYGNLSNDDINSVYTTNTIIDGKAVEFIAVTTPKNGTLERFDFGLCQIMFDGNDLIYTDAFKKDLDNKTMTLLRADSVEQYERSVRRYNRLTEKHPEFSFDPAGFKERFQPWMTE